VKECKQSGQQIACTISATNKSQKKRRLVRCSSTLSDDRGKQYQSSGYALFGEDSATLWADIAPNLPVNMAFSYQDVDPETKYADVVLTCGSLDGKPVLGKIVLIK
jgi:hypothetical protein